MKSNSSNDIWDEHRWETHINEAEQKSEEIRHFLDKTFGSEGPRWVKILQESESEHEALDAYIEEELLLDEAYLPDDDDDWDIDDFDDFDDDFFAATDSQPLDSDGDSPNADADAHPYPGSDVPFDFDPFAPITGSSNNNKINSQDDDDDYSDESGDDDLGEFDDFDDLDEGEEWKLLSNDHTLSDFGSLDNLDVYDRAHAFGTHMLVRSAHLYFEKTEDQHLYNLFMADVLQISAKIAAGYTLGFFDDMLGGNIAFCKKALHAANRALNNLRFIKERNLVFGEIEYRQLHCDLFEIRNDLGIYIQELRDLFDQHQNLM
ncbi:MAG: hypothetical protein JJU35_02030 [Balneolales bacterium]|nr:hypothetical protein [Balneolales bacterium]